MPNIVNSNIRSKRSKLLRLLSNRKKAAFYNKNVGKIHNVLFESEDKNGFIEGFSSNYVRFRRKWDSSIAGTMVESKFTEIDTEGFAI